MEPWGMTGPEFLSAYWAAVGAVFVISVVAAVVGRSGGGGARVDDGRLDEYQLAWLAGGPVRVEQTAIAGLVARDVVRVSRSGVVTPTRSSARPGDPVQEAVLRLIGQSYRLAGRKYLRVEETPVVRGLAQDLQERGYVTSAARARAAKAVHWLFLAVIGVGVARLVNGLSLDRPVGNLVLSLIGTAVLWLIVRVTLLNIKQRPAAKARAVLNEARGHSTSRRGAIPEPSALAGGAMIGAAVLAPVALYGLTAYPDEELSQVFALNARPTGSDSGSYSCSGSSSSCSSSSGSSCGGGGSSCGGGGGCGG